MVPHHPCAPFQPSSLPPAEGLEIKFENRILGAGDTDHHRLARALLCFAEHCVAVLGPPLEDIRLTSPACPLAARTRRSNPRFLDRFENRLIGGYPERLSRPTQHHRQRRVAKRGRSSRHKSFDVQAARPPILEPVFGRRNQGLGSTAIDALVFRYARKDSIEIKMAEFVLGLQRDPIAELRQLGREGHRFAAAASVVQPPRHAACGGCVYHRQQWRNSNSPCDEEGRSAANVLKVVARSPYLDQIVALDPIVYEDRAASTTFLAQHAEPPATRIFRAATQRILADQSVRQQKVDMRARLPARQRFTIRGRHDKRENRR